MVISDTELEFQERPRKVHLFHDQLGATFGPKETPFANTLCKMNSKVPDSHITVNPAEVTCKICRRDARFALLSRARAGLSIEAKENTNFMYGKMALPQYFGYGAVNGMRTRYRRDWRGRLVLQVEETVPYNYDPQHDTAPGGYTGRWRDARLEDMGVGVV